MIEYSKYVDTYLLVPLHIMRKLGILHFIYGDVLFSNCRSSSRNFLPYLITCNAGIRSYEDRCRLWDMRTLSQRRETAGACFIFDLQLKAECKLK